MTNEEIKTALERILRNELDDCEGAIRNGDLQRAGSDLDDAMTKIKRIIRQL